MGSKRHFLRFISKSIRVAVSKLPNVNSAFEVREKVGIPTIGKFSWERTFAKVEQNAPLLFSTLTGIVNRKATDNTLERRNVNLKPKVGTALGCLLHARAPKTCTFLPKLFSIQFWRGEFKRETINQEFALAMMPHFQGLTKSEKSSIRLLRIASLCYRISLKTW